MQVSFMVFRAEFTRPAVLYIAILLIITSRDVVAELAEVVVVSNRDFTGQLTVVKPVEQVDPQFMQGFGMTTADLISRLPGVTLNGQGGSLQAYSIRGLSRARIQTRLAGAPLETERRAGNSASFLDPFLMGRAEVVKGPTSTLYGSGAMGGIVSLAPRQFESAAFMVGTYSEGNQSMFGAGLGNRNLSLGLAYRKQQKSQDTHHNHLNDAQERLSATMSWSHSIQDDLKIIGQVIAARGNELGKSSADYPEKRITNYPREDHLLTSWTLSRDDAWSLVIYGHDQQLDTQVDRPARGLSETRSDSLDYGANGIYHWTQNNADYRIGIEWDKRQDTQVDEIIYDERGMELERFTSLLGSQDVRGGFIDGHWNLDPVTLQLGVRYSSIKQKGQHEWVEDSHWTGVGSAKYIINEEWQIFAQLGSGFRFPELTEKFFNGTTGRGLVKGSPDLVPEQSYSQELGLVWSHGNLQVQSSIYSTRVDDYIERVTIGERLLSYQNIKDGTIRGVEFALNYQWSSQWVLDLNGHWLNGEDDTDMYLSDMSHPRIIINLVHHGRWGEFSLDYRHRFASGRVHKDELPIERFNRLSLAFVFPVNRGLEIKLWADNLLNDDYRLTADDLSARSTKRGAGISLYWHQ
jgi:iron complex outermembrane receptor protein